MGDIMGMVMQGCATAMYHQPLPATRRKGEMELLQSLLHANAAKQRAEPFSSHTTVEGARTAKALGKQLPMDQSFCTHRPRHKRSTDDPPKTARTSVQSAWNARVNRAHTHTLSWLHPIECKSIPDGDGNKQTASQWHSCDRFRRCTIFRLTLTNRANWKRSWMTKPAMVANTPRNAEREKSEVPWAEPVERHCCWREQTGPTVSSAFVFRLQLSDLPLHLLPHSWFFAMFPVGFSNSLPANSGTLSAFGRWRKTESEG